MFCCTSLAVSCREAGSENNSIETPTATMPTKIFSQKCFFDSNTLNSLGSVGECLNNNHNSPRQPRATSEVPTISNQAQPENEESKEAIRYKVQPLRFQISGARLFLVGVGLIESG